MSQNIPAHYTIQYADNVQMLLQQRQSKFRMAVTEGSYTGKQASPVNQVGPVVAKRRTTRYPQMVPGDANHNRRWLFPADYDIDPMLIDSIDKARMVTDPQSTYVTSAVAAMNRAIDDEVITNFFGDNKTGEDGGTTVSFPAAQQISVNEGGTGSGMNVQKLKKALELFLTNQVDLDIEEVWCAIAAKQHTNLMNEIQVISKDFNSKPVLDQDGLITRWGKFRFINSERLPTNGSGHRRCPVWVKTGVHMGIFDGIQTDVSIRKDLAGLPVQVYAKGTIAATRIEEGKCIEIPCVEA